MRPPVTDWATDFDILDPAWVDDPYAIWDQLRATCPVAHTERYFGAYMPVRYADIRDIAYDTDHFSSQVVVLREKNPPDRGGGPPITSDPPHHRVARMALLPPFTPQAVAKLAPMTRAYCNELIDAFCDTGQCDAALQFARHIPVKVLAFMLGVPDRDGDLFRRWVHGIFQAGITDDSAMHVAISEMTEYFRGHLEARRHCPGEDVISSLLAARHPDGRPFSDKHILASLRVLMLGGIDTTWSSIGSAIWHLATHAGDRQRLVLEPELLPLAVEEFLRAYAPVTMAREIVADVTVGGCPYKKGQMVVMTFPAANRDPAAFADADKVIIDRKDNKHIAFGIGIHRCIGAHLARMELTVATEVFLNRIPEFRLNGSVSWSPGTVRGPSLLPIAF